MVNETATALTEAELKTANTTGQPWRQVSERIGFNTDEPGEPDTCDRSLGGKLATYAELQDPNTSVSRCGKKLFVFCEKRRDTRDGTEVQCATLATLLITESPEHWHLETDEAYIVLDVDPDSHMVVGNTRVPLKPGMVILLPRGQQNKHGAFGKMRAMMLFTPGLTKRLPKERQHEFNPQRDEQETGRFSRSSAAELPELPLGVGGATTDGGIVIAQIPPHFWGEPKSGPRQSPFERGIPGLHVKAMTVNGDSPLSIQDHPGVTKILVVLGGEGKVFAGNRIHTVEKDSTILIPPGLKNGVVADSGAMNVLVAYLAGDREEIVREGFERSLAGFTRAHIEQALLAVQ